MASTKTRSKHHNALCQKYKESRRYATNKVKKIERHLRKQPNDKVAEQALKAAKTATPSRGNITSCTQKWTRELKAYAHTLRKLGHNGNDALEKIERFMYAR